MPRQKFSRQPRRATVKTISDQAGVSASTVSRALHGDPRISESTRSRIEEIAKSEGYTPNAMAVGLVTRQSGVIGLAVGRLDNPFYATLIERLHAELVTRGRRAMILNVGGDALDEETTSSRSATTMISPMSRHARSATWRVGRLGRPAS